ncbi:MAG: DEAD/DEAH box helicase [Eubacteriales bacterium]
MSQSFKQFQLRDFLLEGLEKLGITTPTPIQMQAIPAILQGKDVTGRSQTGTGKTLAYVLPVLQQLDGSRQELQALVLAPTRELSRQIADTIGQLTGETGIEAALIHGGVDINRQIQRLKRNPQVIVGTPGRVFDLIKQEKLTSYTAKYLVIDEADMMLEMGFKEDIENILQKMKKDVQIMLFAATLPQKVAGMVKSFMKQPRHIEINPGELTIPAIENVYFKVRMGGKEEALLQLVRLYNPYLGIVFARKKEQVNDLVAQLHQAGIKAEGLHGDMMRGQRKQVMRRFREAKSQLLVATDLASRGLDIEGVTHIFNFDPPINVDQYINRIGRTGRAGNTGIAVNIVNAAEIEQLRYIENKLGLTFTEKTIKADMIVDKPVRRKGRAENEEQPQRKLKALARKFTGPNAKKKAIKESQQRKKHSKPEAPGEKGKKNDSPTGIRKKVGAHVSGGKKKDGLRGNRDQPVSRDKPVNRDKPVKRGSNTGSPVVRRGRNI